MENCSGKFSEKVSKIFEARKIKINYFVHPLTLRIFMIMKSMRKVKNLVKRTSSKLIVIKKVFVTVDKVEKKSKYQNIQGGIHGPHGLLL